MCVFLNEETSTDAVSGAACLLRIDYDLFGGQFTNAVFLN